MELDEEMSLSELEDLLDAQEASELAEARPDLEYYGEVAAEDFDPLNRTGVGAWLKTAGGTYFLPVGKDAYVLIVESEEAGRFDVAWMTQDSGKFLYADCPGMAPYVTPFTCMCGGGHQGAQAALTEHLGLGLDMATSWAEEVLEELGGSAALLLAGNGKRWRKAEVSEAQRTMASRLGIEVTEEMTKGDVSDRISEVIGSRRIDPLVGLMKMIREQETHA